MLSYIHGPFIFLSMLSLQATILRYSNEYICKYKQYPKRTEKVTKLCVNRFIVAVISSHIFKFIALFLFHVNNNLICYEVHYNSYRQHKYIMYMCTINSQTLVIKISANSVKQIEHKINHIKYDTSINSRNNQKYKLHH